MNEEEFLKEHPSLNGRIHLIRRCSSCDSSNLDESWCYSCYDNVKTYYSQEIKIQDIKKTQLDKQKVTEAIKKLEETHCYGFPELKKELGLE